MAASLLADQEQNIWDIWIAPTSFPSDAATLVRQVLDEIHIWFEVLPLKLIAWDYGVRQEITYAGA